MERYKKIAQNADKKDTKTDIKKMKGILINKLLAIQFRVYSYSHHHSFFHFEYICERAQRLKIDNSGI